MVFVHQYAPKHGSIWKVFGITLIYTVFIAILNLIFKGNYLFICWKPENGSLLDVIGPWPWHSLFTIQALYKKIKIKQNIYEAR